MTVTHDQILEAVEALEKIGFTVVSKQRGYINQSDKEQIAEQIKHREESAIRRLEAMGLSVDDLKNLETHEYYQDGQYKGHELHSISNALMVCWLLQGDLRADRVKDLFTHALHLGGELPSGDGPHHYDAQRNLRRFREQRGKSGAAARKENNPWWAYAAFLKDQYPDKTQGEIYRKIPKSLPPIDNEPDDADEIDGFFYYRVVVDTAHNTERLIAKSDRTGKIRELPFPSFQKNYLSKLF